MTPTQALKRALELEQERSQTLEAVVKALQTELKAEKAKVTALQAQFVELRQAGRALLRTPEGGRCRRCDGSGRYHPPCYRCDDSTDDHECPPSRDCETCKGKGLVAEALAFASLAIPQEGR